MSAWFSAAADVGGGRLRGWLGDDRDRVAVRFLGDRSFTVGELWDSVSLRAEQLVSAGLRRGDRLCLMQGNRPDFMLDLLAAFQLGVVVVPLNTALRGESLARTLADMAPCLVRVEKEFEGTVRAAAAGITGTIVWPVGGDPEAGFVGETAGLDEAEPDRGDLAVILLTSGTTGPPKGVMWPHEMALGVAQHTTWVMGYDSTDVIYTCLPLFHINGLFCALYAGLLVGAEVVIAERFSASRYWSEIAECGATVTNMMGSIPAVLWRREPEPAERAHHLRFGMVLPLPATWQEFEERFGFATTETYGSTDSGLPLGIPFGARRPGSCGIPAPGWQADVVDERDEPVPPDTVGELVFRPLRPYLGQAGYWRRPETTVAATRNMWFHTGDAVSRDAEGWYAYHGRQKDMIRVSGENVAPSQVEVALLRHPAVDEVAVYGLPSDLGEEAVAAAVVLKSDSGVEPGELRGFVEADLPYFAVPRYILFVDELPKTQTSKVIKTVLQERGVTSEHWDGGRPRRTSVTGP
jgi:crotonobetaine/carnitine-CoA ligase